MKSVCCTVVCGSVALRAWLDMAGQWMDAARACVLAETPRRVVFRKLEQGLAESDLTEAFSCIVFDAHAELRLEKAPGKADGQFRLLHEREGEQMRVREQRYLLRRVPEGLEASRLIGVEYFRKDASGMLLPHAVRLAGVEVRP